MLVGNNETLKRRLLSSTNITQFSSLNLELDYETS
jgi:hypothetical protein